MDANPKHRLHQQAARGVLKALLPDSGTDIKGHMRSRGDLLDASGYAARPGNFGDLLGILDGEIRLITPIDPEGKEGAEESATQSQPGRKYYQLTHDYLVPSLRDWLTRKQRETRRGRAELLLAERAATWTSKPFSRHLPAWWEHLRIRALTRKASWDDLQRRMMRASRRYHAVRWGAALVALMALGFTVQKYESGRRAEVAHQTAENDRKRAESLADAVFTAPPDSVSFAIENLRPLRDLGLPILEERFADETKPRSQRLHAAFGLAASGQVESAFLVECVATATDGECRNLVAALSQSRDAALKSLHERFSTTDEMADAKSRARLAIVALHLGDARPAIEVCRIKGDPAPRRIFEETLTTWNSGVVELLKHVEAVADPQLRSAVCLGVGRIAAESLSNAERHAGATVLVGWYRHARDAGTHSAAAWALRQWMQEWPILADASHPTDQRDWYVNSQGMTMLKVYKGQFRMGSDRIGDAKPVNVTLTRDYYLADQEVSVRHFQQFIDDSNTPATEKPDSWLGHDKRISPSGTYPMQAVSWYDSVLFCNWLSRREGLMPCYERTGGTEKLDEIEHDVWRLVPKADGYRLPTEAEWEYACRAGTTSNFSCGNDEESLRQYATFSSTLTTPCGSRFPNSWGLFDMHGNVVEWCFDSYKDVLPGGRDPEVSNLSSDRVYRSGCWLSSSRLCRSAYRGWHTPAGRFNYFGFRVAAGR